MTFAENRTYGVPEFAGTEVNRHSGKLKGLSGGQGKKGLHHNMENTLACEEVKQYMHLQAVSFNILDKPLQAILDQIQEECEKMQTNTNRLRCLTCGALCAINISSQNLFWLVSVS